jgi:hypothetical protein
MMLLWSARLEALGRIHWCRTSLPIEPGFVTNRVRLGSPDAIATAGATDQPKRKPESVVIRDTQRTASPFSDWRIWFTAFAQCCLLHGAAVEVGR